MNYRQIIQAAAFFAVIVACAGKKDNDSTSQEATVEKTDTTAAASSRDWKEMDEFHMIMAETFHPYKDNSNLVPVKEKAKELEDGAAKWANAPLPAKVDNEEMKSKLQLLKTETANLTSMVSKSTDDAIGAQLTKVHDIFHEIQETWYGGHDHQH
jgi:hypothetical protein